VTSALRAVAAVYNWLVNALAVLSAASVAMAFVLIILDVTIRTLGFSPPSYTIAVVEYSLLYMAMFAAPYLVRQKGHVFVDAVTNRLPPAAARWVARFAYLLSILASLVFSYYACVLLVESLQSGLYDERSIDIPMWLLYLPIPIGFGFVSVEFARYLIGLDTMYTDRTKPRDSV
jgi:C4-dicarboxylate transporter, DctQ subunit